MEININGLNIRYKISGPADSDKTAVILQGWGTDMRIYDLVANSINDVYRVIQLNLPGFSDSDEPDSAWSVSDFCHWFMDFMKSIKITHAILIGHSYGCRMMIRMAGGAEGELPFSIDKIIMIDGAGIVHEKTPAQKRSIARYHRKKALYTNPLVYFFFKDAVDIWMGQQGSPDYRNSSPIMKKCMVKAINEDQSQYLKNIKQETLLIWGDKDTATPLGDGKIMEREIPNSGLAVIEGTGHFSYAEKPAVFVRIMRTFLKLDDQADDQIKTEKNGSQDDDGINISSEESSLSKEDA